MTDRAMHDYFERIESAFVTGNDGYEVFWPEGNNGYYAQAPPRDVRQTQGNDCDAQAHIEDMQGPQAERRSQGSHPRQTRR